LNLTATGKGVMIAIGLAGLFIAAAAARAHQLALARFQFEDAAQKYQAGEFAERQTGAVLRRGRELNMPLVKTPKIAI
jgi:hypothetical protein